MTKGNQIKRALAVSTALSVVALGATTTTAHATLDQGKSQSKSQGASQSAAKSHGKAKGHGKKSSASHGSSHQGGSQNTPGNGNGQAKGHAKGDDHPSTNNPSNGGQSGGQGSSQGPAGEKAKDSQGKGGDPAGNNGTVKITPHGELDGIPQNTPHVGCDFDVEWYGFDEGDDIFSIVTFEAWAPTRGDIEVVRGTVGAPGVFVGADPASGAGVGSDADGTDADNGFDGEEHYELAFPGIEPHPKQGYHVKLTINTPGSQGADVKHKVFWVQECETSTPPVTTENPVNPETPDVAGEQGNDLSTEVDTEVSADVPTDIEVLGEQAAVDAQVKGVQGNQTLPSAVNAGLTAATWATGTLPIAPLLALVGALVAGLGLLVRRRIG